MNQSPILLLQAVKKTQFRQLVNSLYQTPIALGVLLLGLVLTAFSWHYTSRTVTEETTALLDEQINEALHNRIQVYLDTFYAARGFWVAEDLEVPYEQWKVFVASLKLQKRYPGINGLGFIRYIPKDLDLTEYEQRVRQDNASLEVIYQDYRVHPKGNRPDYFVIEYSEPIFPNREAIGLDVSHEPVRRKGAERARDSGKPAATGQIILVQDEAKTPGLLIYLPIYRPGMPVNTVEKRRRAFFGFIYAPFRVLDLVEEGLPNSVKQNFDLVIYNGEDLMYSTADERPTADSSSRSRYYKKISLDVAGETWDLYFTSNSNLTISGQNLPQIVLVVGTLCSLLLFGIVWSLGISYRQTKEAKEASDAAREAADTANKAKSEFLANMSHELRTPLNAILGFTQIMNRDSTLNQGHQENLGIISRSGEHLLSLINDVLDMSKIEAGRISLNQTSFDLHQLLTLLEEMLELRAESKGLQLIFELAPELPPYVKTDESKLRQVLINLLGNAIKFTEQGSVTLRVGLGKRSEGEEKRGRRGDSRDIEILPMLHSQTTYNKQQITNNQQSTTITFEIEDTGSGIALEELDTLFEAFIQTETGRKSQEGTGLGLPISQKFVQLMGGEITVSSILGQGTIFRFDVQVELAQATDIETPKPSRQVIGIEPNQPVYRILVVDDRWENRRVLIKLLTEVGFEVNQATNGQEALTLWENWQPHLIWMDMRMPVMNGYEATRQIRAREQERWEDEEIGRWGDGEMGKMRREGDNRGIPNSQFPIPHFQTTNNKQQTTNTIIIALTASTFEEERAVVLAVGCDDFVRKPFQESVIFDKIAEQLGVQYIYQQPEENQETVESQGEELPTSELIALHFSQMPRDWVKQLHQTAVKLNAKETLQLIEQIPPEHSPLAVTLNHWVSNFRFDKITDLTETAIV